MDCQFCSSDKTIKRGHHGKHGQRFICKSCNKTFSTGGKRVRYSFKEKSHIAKVSQGYGNLIRTCKTYHISPKTIYKWRLIVDKHNKKIQNMMGHF